VPQPQPQPSRYHHGDLRAACLRAARELLTEDGSAALSMRAVARRAGVSATAPYRHFADREALVSAVAAQGYRELAADLAAAHPPPTDPTPTDPAAAHLAAVHPGPSRPEDLADIGIAYIRFALDHPALFRLMFAEPCDPTSAERVAATEAITAYLHTTVARALGTDSPEPVALTLWALVHGLAFLHLDGKLASFGSGSNAGSGSDAGSDAGSGSGSDRGPGSDAVRDSVHAAMVTLLGTTP
jgi:AcrR family transcriptional regulator